MVTPQEIKEWLEHGLQDAEVHVSGDGHHFDATIISDLFEGKNSLQRHRLVYAALGSKMGAEIHALSIKTFTKSEKTV